MWETSFHTKLPENIPEAGISLVLPNPIAVLFGNLELGLTQATDEARKAWNDKRARFIASLYHRKRSEVDLWPSQLAAVDTIFNSNDNAVVSLPTSAGKTRIAELAILMCLAAGRRVVFVTPLRALSAQTEAGLAKTFTPLGATVSSLYGSMGSATTDDDLLADRDIIVATPEKLDFALRNTPELLDGVGLVVLDEGHMIGLGEREVRYEVQIQRLLLRDDANSRRILCLSAVLPDDDKLEDFVGWLSNDSEDGLITANWRATGQQFGTVSWAGEAARLDIQVGDQTPFVPNYLTAIVPKGRRKKAFPTDQKELVIATAWRQIEEGHTVLIYHPVKRFVEPMARHILKLRKQGLLGDLPTIDSTALEVCLLSLIHI